MNTAEFQRTVLKSAVLPKKVTDKPDKVVAEYAETRRKSLAQADKLGVGSNGKEEICHKLAAEFMRRWMSLRYATLDLSFTEQKMFLRVDRLDDQVVLRQSKREHLEAYDPTVTVIAETGQFFSTDYDAMEWCLEQGAGEKVEDRPLGSFLHGKRQGVSYRREEVMIHAKVPDGANPEKRDLVCKAIAFCQMGAALALEARIDLVAELKQSSRSYHERDIQARLYIIWAPLVEQLSVTMSPPPPKGDPAIVLHIAGIDFLIDFYDTPNERPISNLIREFSEGKLKRG